MTNIELEIHDDVVTTINKIKNINDSGIELSIPLGSVLFDNIINLKLLKAYEDKLGMTIHFSTQDEQGNNLIEMLEGTVQIGIGDDVAQQFKEEVPSTPKLKKLKRPKIKVPNFKFGIIAVVLVILLLVGGGGIVVLKALSSKPIATAKIFVDAQPLTRSITIRISSQDGTDIDSKILKGIVVETSLDQFQKIDTTGEKLEGDKAEGKVTIFNKTSDEVELDKGTELMYKEDDEDLTFITKDDLIIPAISPEDPLDPGSPLIPGEKEVEIEATNIGDEYNLDDGTTLELDDHKKSELVGEVSESLDGGSSKKINVVSEEDIETLTAKINEEMNDLTDDSLIKKVDRKNSYINGSAETSGTEKEFSHEAGDETEELGLTQKVSIKGLSYAKDSLDKFLDDIVAELIPEGFELYKGDRDTKVDVLGNSSNSVLSSTEADVQVTLKTYIVPIINVDEIKENLKGKTPEEAQKDLGSISNIKTYEFNLAPNIPFFGNVPKDPERIIVELVKE